MLVVKVKIKDVPEQRVHQTEGALNQEIKEKRKDGPGHVLRIVVLVEKDLNLVHVNAVNVQNQRIRDALKRVLAIVPNREIKIGTVVSVAARKKEIVNEEEVGQKNTDL